MTYGPPPEPNAPGQRPDAPGPNVAYPAPVPPHPQQPWGTPTGYGWPGAALPVDPPKGVGLAVAAVVLGLLGCALPLLPVNLDNVRAYVPFPFGVAGLVLAVLGCVGRRRGKPLAVVGGILSVLALVMGMIMIAGRLA